MRSFLAPSLLLLFLVPEVVPGACAAERFASLPAMFPLDAFVFRGEVVEISIPESEGQDFVLVVSVFDAVHVPVRRQRFELTLLAESSTCQEETRLGLQELSDLYRPGDLLHIAAFPIDSAEKTLISLNSWVRLAPDVRRQHVEDPYDYFGALLRTESVREEREKVKVLRSIADFLESREQYEALLREQMISRRLRKQLLSVHQALHSSDG